MIAPWLRIFLLAALCVDFLLTGCGQAGSDAKAGQSVAPPPVSVAPVTKRMVQEFDEFTGRLEAVDTVDVRARVAGTLDKVHFRDGQMVKKGDVLFTIDPRPFAMEVARLEARIATARTQAELAKSELARGAAAAYAGYLSAGSRSIACSRAQWRDCGTGGSGRVEHCETKPKLYSYQRAH